MRRCNGCLFFQHKHSAAAASHGPVMLAQSLLDASALWSPPAAGGHRSSKHLCSAARIPCQPPDAATDEAYYYTCMPLFLGTFPYNAASISARSATVARPGASGNRRVTEQDLCSPAKHVFGTTCTCFGYSRQLIRFLMAVCGLWYCTRRHAVFEGFEVARGQQIYDPWKDYPFVGIIDLSGRSMERISRY